MQFWDQYRARIKLRINQSCTLSTLLYYGVFYQSKTCNKPHKQLTGIWTESGYHLVYQPSEYLVHLLEIPLLHDSNSLQRYEIRKVPLTNAGVHSDGQLSPQDDSILPSARDNSKHVTRNNSNHVTSSDIDTSYNSFIWKQQHRKQLNHPQPF